MARQVRLGLPEVYAMETDTDTWHKAERTYPNGADTKCNKFIKTSSFSTGIVPIGAKVCANCGPYPRMFGR